MYMSAGLHRSSAKSMTAERDQSYTLMVVVKCTSALAAILTRNNTALLSAEPNPTLPFVVLAAICPPRCSLDESDELRVFDETGRAGG